MAIDGGDLFVDVNPDLTNFLPKLTAGLNSVVPGITKASSALTVGLGVAFGAAAVVATKAALDFDKAFTQIAAVSNASAADIANWRGEVLSLAGETAQAPQELADALYFLASAGLSSGQVMETLEMSAKASAVGLGETSDIARLTANALNAYASSGLTATEVTDTLVEAVKAGTAEPDEFADALGRILPIASRAGVGFDEVTASLAALSNIGLDVNEGVTAMRGLLQALVAPGSQAAQALAEAGIATEEMRRVLQEEGLLAALNLLEEATGGNIDVLRDIVPNIRSLTGELGLTGENAAQVAAIFEQVSNASGALGESFQTTTEGAMFPFEQALAKGQAALIALGDVFVPIARTVAELAGSVFGTFASVLSENTALVTNLVLAFLGFKAITFVPALITAISTALSGMAASGLLSIAFGLDAISISMQRIGAARAGTALGAAAVAVPELTVAATAAAAAFGAFAVAAIGVSQIMKSVAVDAVALREEFDTLDATTSQIADAAADGFGLSDITGFLADPFALSGTRAKEFAGTMDELNRKGVEQGLTLAETNKILTEHGDLLNYNRESQTGFIEAVERGFSEQVRTNTDKALTGILDFAVGVTKGTKAGAELITTYDMFGDVLLDNQKLTLDQKAIVAAQIDQIYQLGGSLTAAEQAWVDQALAAGDFAAISEKLGQDLEKLNRELESTASTGSDAFTQMLQDGTQLASALGVSFSDLREQAFTAFIADGRAFGPEFDKVVADIQGKVLDLQAGFTESLGGFTDQALQGLVESAHLTTDSIVKSFDEAARATRRFGEDLLTIAREGGQGGKDLASRLLEIGPAAANFAGFVADASGKARDSIIRAFSRGESAAESLGTKLTRSIAGALGDIRSLLEQIVRQDWGIPVTVEDRATAQIEAVKARLEALDGQTAVMYIKAIQQGFRGSAAGDPDWQGGLGWVGEQGPELVSLPKHTRIFSNRDSEAIVNNMTGAGGVGRSEFVITNWKTGEGYMRAFAADEDNSNHRYRRRMAEMGGRE